MKRLVFFFIVITINWAAFAANRLLLCAGMSGDDMASCETKLQLLVRGRPESSGAIHAVANSGKWIFQYQNADAEPHCAIYTDRLILASNRQTRSVYTSNDQVIDLDIDELDVRKTAFPVLVSELTISGVHLAAKANAYIKAELRDAGSASIHVDVLKPDAHSVWEKGFT